MISQFKNISSQRGPGWDARSTVAGCQEDVTVKYKHLDEKKDDKEFVMLPRREGEGTPRSSPKGSDLVVSTLPIALFPASEMKQALKSVGLVGLGSLMKVPSTQTWILRLTRFASLTTNGSGGLAITTVVAPSQFMQYTSVNALFRECRLRRTKITYTPKIAPDTAGLLNGIMHSAFDNNGIASDSISTSDEVDRFANSIIFSCNTTQARAAVNTFRCPARPWSHVDSSSGGLDPVGGISGSWLHFFSNSSFASTNVADYLIEAWYEFRTLQ
jgi:hypothetical protein